MTLEQLCCSLESAKRLRELGVTKESYAYYCVGEIPMNPCILVRDHDEIINSETNIQTYTAAELLEVLPMCVYCSNESLIKKTHFIKIDKHNEDFCVGYYHQDESIYGLLRRTGSSLSECCALCLICLLENNLVSLEEVNR